MRSGKEAGRASLVLLEAARCQLEDWGGEVTSLTWFQGGRSGHCEVLVGGGFQDGGRQLTQAGDQMAETRC